MAKQNLLPEKRGEQLKVDFNAIDVDPTYNTRTDYGDLEELSKSILEHGVQIAMMVKRHPEKEGRFILIRGHRRYKAGKILVDNKQVTEFRVKVELVPRGMSEVDLLVDQEISNTGNQLKMMERAELVKRLLAFNLSHEEIAKKLIKSITFIQNCVLLLELPKSTKTMINDGIIKPTLVIDILKKEKNMDKAIATIEGLYASIKAPVVSKSSPTTPASPDNTDSNESSKKSAPAKAQKKPVITKKHLNKAAGKHSSLSFFGKIVKASEDDREVKKDQREIFDLIKGIIEGKYSKEELEEMFLEKME